MLLIHIFLLLKIQITNEYEYIIMLYIYTSGVFIFFERGGWLNKCTKYKIYILCIYIQHGY